MAQTLAPILGASLSGEAPVAQPSSFEAAASLIQGFASTLTQQKGSGPSEGDRKLARENQFFTDMKVQEKRALEHESAGEYDTATRIRRQAVLNAPKFGVDTSSGEFKSFLYNLTGRDGESYAMTPDEIQRQRIVESESFNKAYVALPSTMDPREREAYAISEVQEKEALEHRLSMAGVDWEGHGKASVTEYITKEIVSAHNVIKNLQNPTGPVSTEALQGLNTEWDMFATRTLGNLPTNLTPEQRKPIEDLLAKNKAVIEGALTLASTGDKTINGATAEALTRQLSDTLSSQGQVENVYDLLSRRELITGNMETWVAGGLNTKGFVDAMAKAGSLKIAGTDTFESVERNAATVYEGFSSNDEAYKFAEGIGKSLGTPQSGAEIKASPESRTNWITDTHTFIEGISRLGNEANGGWITEEQLAESFSPGFFANLDELSTHDPEAADKIRLHASKALDGQKAQLNRLLSSMEAQEPNFIWDRTQGRFALNPNPVTGLPAQMQPHLQRAVSELYGGDVNALIADKGQKVREAGYLNPQGVGTSRASVGRALMAQGDKTVWRDLSGYLSSYFTQSVPANGDKYAKASRKLEDLTNRLVQAPEEDLSLEQERPALSSSIQTFQELPNFEGSMTQKMMDQYEGGGNYDTLFGHSQNSRFKGIVPSQMTVAEVLDFQNPKGEYGNWVKGELGRSGQKARIATPVGRFQFVGTTLREVSKEMGIDINNTVFDAKTQNAMFSHYANKITRGKSGASARAALRGGWEGFKYVSDADLDTIIQEIQSGKPLFDGSVAGNFSAAAPGAAGSLASTDMSTVLGNETSAAQESSAAGSTALSQSEVMEGTPTQGQAPVATPTAADGPSASQASTEQTNAQLAAETQAVLKSFGLSDSTPVFTTRKELNKAIREGKVDDGQTVLVDGKPEEV